MSQPAISQPQTQPGRVGIHLLLALAGSYLLLRYEPVATLLEPGGLGFLLNAVWLLALVGLALGHAQNNWRVFLKLDTFDWRGILWGFGLFALLTLAERLVLEALLLAPLRVALIGIGLTQTASFYSEPLPMAVLLLPVAEELFFRGYTQQQLQRVIGVRWALLVTTVIWSLWHVWAPHEFMRRIIAGLCVEGLLFAWRQNTWPSLVVHTSRVAARALVW